MRTLLTKKPVQIVLGISLAAYIAIVSFAYARYQSLILNPVVAYNAMVFQFQGETGSLESKVSSGLSTSIASFEASKGIQQRALAGADTSKAKLAEQSAKKAATEQASLPENFKALALPDELVASQAELQPIKTDQITLTEAELAIEAERFERMQTLGADAPTEAQMRDLLAKTSGAQQQSNTIPARVLNRVEQTTGISPEEIEALLEAEQ